MRHPATTAFKMWAVMTLLTGLIYPLFITLISQIAMPRQAGGSLIRIGDQVIGSELIAQSFKGNGYFWPRPSAVDFNPIQPAGGSHLGPTSQKLKDAVKEKVKRWGPRFPPELIYASGSGLDPHISLETAYFQIERVAEARLIADPAQLRSLVNSLAEGYKEKYVNVLLLNHALDQRFPDQLRLTTPR